MIYIAQSVVALPQSALKLTWEPNTESDLLGYRVYKEESGDTQILTPHLLQEPEYITGILDLEKPHIFIVTAFDIHHNESEGTVIEYTPAI